MEFWTNSAISLAIGAIITAMGNFVLGLRKQKVQDQLALNKQAFDVFAASIDTLKKDKDSLEKDFAQLSKMNLECREKCAGVQMENKYLTAEITSLRSQLAISQKNPR